MTTRPSDTQQQVKIKKWITVVVCTCKEFGVSESESNEMNDAWEQVRRRYKISVLMGNSNNGNMYFN